MDSLPPEISGPIKELASQLSPVATERLSIENAPGRVLAEPLFADRDSPALHVSAMDGFAVRWQDVQQRASIPVSGVAAAGCPPLQLPLNTAVQIFTGAPIPTGADTVIPVEQCDVANEVSGASHVSIPEAAKVQVGQHIRYQGENVRSGELITPAGNQIDGAGIAAIASFGSPEAMYYRKVRVAVLNTGDELQPPGAPVQPWQIRDSNGPVLTSWIHSNPWLSTESKRNVPDRLDAVIAALQSTIEHCDAVLLTGGVSMGETDYVPDAIRQIGGEILFHRLPIRPGKPVLGAICQGKPIIGLPGNPVSVAVTARVIAEPILAKIAGFTNPSPLPRVRLVTEDSRTLHLTWFRLVHLAEGGFAQPTASRGSGDLVSLAKSMGFVAIPPGEIGEGPWPFYAW